MEKLNMINMAKKEDESKELAYPASDQSLYPYGLCISLCNEELDKLGIGEENIEVGNILHLHALASVTSVSQNTTIHSGATKRIELQITHLSTPESEEDENAEAEKKMTSAKEKITKLYSTKS